MSRHDKLFRAIVILGAAITASACDDRDCGKCLPIDARPDTVVADAGVDTPPGDAPVDVVLII